MTAPTPAPRRRPRARATLVALLALAALLGTACGGSQQGGDLSGGSARSGNAISPADPNSLRQGGDFLWSLDYIPPNFNYNQLNGSDAMAADVNWAILPQILKGDANGNVTPDPDYLQSADVTGTNPQVVTYRLNPKAAWSTGRPIDWTDFDAQFRALNGSNKAYEVASNTGYQDIASVRPGATPEEVVVTYKQNFGDWRSLFTPLYPRETNNDPVAFNTGWANQPQPISGGPFIFQSLDQTSKRLTVVRNPKWWGTPARLDRIIYVALDRSAQPEAFANGSLSFFDIGSSVANLQRARQTPGADVRTANGPNYNHLTFNGAPGSLLADPQLRLALQRGIDRSIITRALIGPIVPDAAPLGNHIYVQGLEGYQDNSGVVAFNVQQANADLDRLGWVRHGDVRVKDGRPLRPRLVIPTGNPVSDQVARFTQQQLSALGAQVDIQAVPSDNFFDQYVQVGNFDIAAFAWLGTQFPVSSSGSIYRTLGPTEQNYGRVGSPQINDLIARSSAELDPAKQRQLANQLDQAVWASGHSLLLFQRPDAVATRPNVANFGAKGFADLRYQDIGFRP
jgi:peptide/nickel transport system substrate-binding protein